MGEESALTRTSAPAMSTESERVSRYRALRGKSVSESRKAIDDALGESKQDQPKENTPFLRRSAFGSRIMKRRSKTLSQIDTSEFREIAAHFPVPPVPQVPLTPREHNIASRPRAAVKPVSIISEATGKHSVEQDRIQSSRATSPPPFTFPVARAVTTDNAVRGSCDVDWERPEHEEQKGQLDEEEAARLADRLEAETDRILAEQKKLDLARLHQQLLATQSGVPVSLGTTSIKARSPVLGKLNFFVRGRSSKAATLSPVSSTTASVDYSRAQSLDPMLSPRAFFEPGGHCLLMTPPLSPMSSNQNNERTVIVRYRGLNMNLTVMPDTSTVDLLFQASDSVTHTINTASSVVYECYSQLGLERRLRRYERIRNVLNSWDRDTQNILLILPSSSVDSDRDLDMSSVPSTQAPTAGFILQMHHSSRPGKWNKRWITLSENGQMLSSKKAGPHPSGKDSQYLCHLSDYDIYTIMSDCASGIDEAGANSASSVVKNLKPPKKFVYAVKSQRRTMAHADTANFVHFFCTDDPAVAHRFHASVHAWRSWYMVKARREAQRKRIMDAERDRPPQITPIRHNKTVKSVSHVKVPGLGHRMRVSIDETPYTIGEFQPLVDLQRFDKPIDEFGKDWIPDPRLSALLPSNLDVSAAGTDGGATPNGTADGTATIAATGIVTPAPTPTVEEVVMSGLWGMSSGDRCRKQIQRKASSATGQAAVAQRQTVDGSQASGGGVSIAISSPTEGNTPTGGNSPTKPPSSRPRNGTESEPSSSPRPEPRSWLPSAAEHTARIKAEQERLERLYNSAPRLQQQHQHSQQPQRPSTSTGIAPSQRHTNLSGYQQYSPPYARGGRHGGGGGGGSGKRTAGGYPAALGDMAGHIRAVSQWAEMPNNNNNANNANNNNSSINSNGMNNNGNSNNNPPPSPSSFSSSRPRFLEVPDPRAMPPLLRKPSAQSMGRRPSTSGGERGRTQGQQSQLQLQGRGRSGSVASARRGQGGGNGNGGGGGGGGGSSIGSPPLGSLPPVPPMPPHIRPATRDGSCVGGGSGGGFGGAGLGGAQGLVTARVSLSAMR
ncbi:hypothetical protein SLS53_005107 [Cytospora paraplurivora]|uniref:PH domain-containing protein n=1 Tax=Cytospora paraplurivora TaxID=2898453 RepID=A0AAN9U6X0_9PEZI